ncbi:MAG: hypothetical protein HYX27_27600 [Acidobacteria bacterium]|nr:hypothetical protein [Acidobacteriota bacterium]
MENARIEEMYFDAKEKLVRLFDDYWGTDGVRSAAEPDLANLRKSMEEAIHSQESGRLLTAFTDFRLAQHGLAEISGEVREKGELLDKQSKKVADLLALMESN